MHPTQRALAIVEGDVGLSDQRLQSVFRELVLAKGPREEPSAVLARLDVDDECASELGFLKDHSFSPVRSEEHTSELQSQSNLVCRLLLEKKNDITPAQILDGEVRSQRVLAMQLVKRYQPRHEPMVRSMRPGLLVRWSAVRDVQRTPVLQ